MRRLRLMPLATVLGAVLLAGALACTPSTPAPAGGQGGGTPAPTEDTETPATDQPMDESGTATTTPEEGAATADDGTMPAGDAAATTSFDAVNFYAMNCAGCHGAKGEGAEGKGPAYAKVLHEPDSELHDAILNGHGEKMPAFKDKLSAEEATQLLAWIRAEFGAGITPEAEGEHKESEGEGEGH